MGLVRSVQVVVVGQPSAGQGVGERPRGGADERAVAVQEADPAAPGQVGEEAEGGGAFVERVDAVALGMRGAGPQHRVGDGALGQRDDAGAFGVQDDGGLGQNGSSRKAYGAGCDLVTVGSGVRPHLWRAAR